MLIILDYIISVVVYIAQCPGPLRSCQDEDVKEEYYCSSIPREPSGFT